MSQYIDSLLADLSEGEWVCGSYFYSTHRPTFSQRFSELAKKEPGRIMSRVCKRHDHASTVHEYLDNKAAQPRQLSLAEVA